MRLLVIIAAALLVGAGAFAVSLPSEPAQVDEAPGSAENDGCDLEASQDHARAFGDDGVEIAFTVHEPALEEGETVPLILHSHGWAGTRASQASGLVGDLVEACYGVVSIDMRGHGDSGGQAHVHHPDHEIQDVIGILDWAEDELGWIAHDEDGVLVGAIGGSYGGGYQLLTAAHDDRLDAIAPDMTWNDLPYALAPNGAIKSVWVDLLYGAGTAQAELAPFIHQGYAWAQAFNAFPSGELPGEPDVHGMFVDSSPSTYPDAIDVPTLLIQSLDDTLFNLNQAAWNADQIREAGQDDVHLLTYKGGHIVHTDGTLPSEAPLSVGLQPAPAETACTDPDQAVIAWYDWQLKGQDPADLAPVELTLDDEETCHRFDSLDRLDDATHVQQLDGPVAVTQGAPLASGHVEADAITVTAESPASLHALDGSTAGSLAGIPTLTGTATVAGDQAIAYVSLIVDDGEEARVANSQVTPLKLDGPAQEIAFELELGGVGVDLTDADEVRLQISSWDGQFAHNHERAPGGLILEDLELALPAR